MARVTVEIEGKYVGAAVETFRLMKRLMKLSGQRFEFTGHCIVVLGRR